MLFPVQIPFLSKGDLVYITAPAKSIEREAVDHARRVFEEKGYRVRISEHCTGVHHYFSGTEEERMRDLQAGIDDPEVKAIVCARGGYGCVQIMDSIKWAGMLTQPKWLVGFSDVTFFHQHLQFLGLPSLHATMPLNYATNSTEALDTMFAALEGRTYTVKSTVHHLDRYGEVSGKLIGGNLSILYSMLGAKDRPDYSGCILFIEDLCEYIYHVDRMLQAFRRSGILEQISGLIVGGMTEMNDTAVPFGKGIEALIIDLLQYKKIPVCFGFPAGHIDDNRALILGSATTLRVDEKGAEITFHSNP
jgi:muramoyltetrapeptide carboxypeptidase